VTSPEFLDYEVVDVFAPRSFAGNPLAVVFDADRLTTEQCQALAFEFHLSETSFLCAPTEPGADYRVRIFTPFAELPFAGHPSVGAAHTLVRSGRLPAGTLRQECGAGILDLAVDGDGATLTGGRPTLEDGPDPGVLAEAVGLSAADVVGLPAHVVGCGLPWTVLAVRPQVVDEARPDPARLDALGVGEGVVVCAWTAETSTSSARASSSGAGPSSSVGRPPDSVAPSSVTTRSSTPAPHSWRSVLPFSRPVRTRVCAAPTLGWPAKGSSANGVKIRTR